MKPLKKILSSTFYFYLCFLKFNENYMKRIYLLILIWLPLLVQSQISLTVPEIQGAGNSSPYEGRRVTTRGIVTAKYVGNGTINGFFMQDKTGDGNPKTSDGIFVYAPNNSSVSVGDEIKITADVSELNGRTQLSSISDVQVLSKNNQIAPKKITYEADGNWNWEIYEGMLIEFDQTLWVNNNYYLERYGELELGIKRRPSPTNVAFPGTAEYKSLLYESAALPIYLDDAYTSTFNKPIVFADEHGTRRTGEKVDNLKAVVDYINSQYTLYPVEKVEFYGNPRQETHDDLGDYNLKVCGFNLEFYLTAPNNSGMGPQSSLELSRQHTKIMEALVAIDADIYALSEVEQGQNALRKLSNALSERKGVAYDYINDGGSANGTFTKVGYIYRTDKVAPYKSLREINRPTPINRKKIQAFTLKSNNERFILSVNHLKSKSGCGNATGGDGDKDDGQSCYNATRVAEINAVIEALNSAVSYYGDDDILIMGDLNAYAKEDPIQTLVSAGYIDLLHQFHGDSAYSYVYRTEAGTLDHALASKSLAKQVTGATVFHINADELSSFEYGGSYYSPDMYRCSDHDPVVVGLALGKNVNSGMLDFEERVAIYPTIVTEVLNIDRADGAYVQIFSLNGIMLLQEQITSDTYSLEPQKLGLSPGSYLVRVLGEERIVRQLIIVR